MPSGALRVEDRVEEYFEKMDLTREARCLAFDWRRRKSVRNALFPGWDMGSETVAAEWLPNSLPFCDAAMPRRR